MRPFWIILVACLGLSYCARSQGIPDSLATQFIALNQAGRYTEAAAMFDPSLSGQISPTMLQQVWEGMVSQYGPFLRLRGTSDRKLDSLVLVQVESDFRDDQIGFTLVFNPAHLMIGYRITSVRPNKSTAEDSSRFPQQAAELKTATGTLYGTLMVPGSEQGKIPVALILAGSGNVDRNGNSGAMETSDTYKLLAEALAGNGIASLRFDKRGIGQSRDALTDLRHFTIWNYVDDAEGWVRQLQEDPRFSGVFVIGHSEGSLIGLEAAGKAQARGFISISGMGMPMDSILRIHLKGKINDTLYQEALQIMDDLKKGDTVAVVPADLLTLFNLSFQSYLISEFRINPVRDISRLRIPVLVVQGENDIQITVGDARNLAGAVPGSRLVLIPRMTHMLKDAGPTREENLKTYSDPTLPLDTTLVRAIASFIQNPGEK